MGARSQNMSRVLRDTSALVKIGMLSGVAVVLMLLDFPIPSLFPSFLKMDFSDVPAIIGTFAMGPVAGVIIELVKNLLKLIIGTNTAAVGELANFLVGTCYILPLGLVYQRWPNRRGVLLGCSLAVVSMTFFGSLLNYLIFIRAYAWALNVPIDNFVKLAAKINPAVENLGTLVVYAIAPFNLIKGIIMSVLGYSLYKVLTPLWRKLV